MKISFERNENGCFTDSNIINYSIPSDVVEQVIEIDENLYGTKKPIHEIFNSLALFIVVPKTDIDGNTYFEKTKVLLINNGTCPFAGGYLYDENENCWVIEDNDFAFTDEYEADKFEFMSNLELIIKEKAQILANKIETFKMLIILFGLPEDPELLEKVQNELVNIEIETELIYNSLLALNEIIEGIGEN